LVHKAKIRLMNRLLTKLFPIAFAYFFSCQNDIKKVHLYADKSKFPAESITNAEILYSDSGKVTGKLKAKKLDHYLGNHPFTLMPKGVVVNFYDAQLKPETQLSANYAIKYDERDVLEAKGNVVVVNNKGEKLNTEHIVWNQKSEQINSDAFVKITTKTEILMGDGLESNQSFTKYKILKIRGTIQLKDSVL
jgi:LPS export ABC transporter protein LptC